MNWGNKTDGEIAVCFLFTIHEIRINTKKIGKQNIVLCIYEIH